MPASSIHHQGVVARPLAVPRSGARFISSPCADDLIRPRSEPSFAKRWQRNGLGSGHWRGSGQPSFPISRIRDRTDAGDQACAPLEGQVVPDPACGDHEAVPEADQENTHAPRTIGTMRTSPTGATGPGRRRRSCARSSPWRRNRGSGSPAASGPGAGRRSAVRRPGPAAWAGGPRLGAACRPSRKTWAVSPMTKCPVAGKVRSGPTFTRPARSTSSASQRPAGEASTPAPRRPPALDTCITEGHAFRIAGDDGTAQP